MRKMKHLLLAAMLAVPMLAAVSTASAEDFKGQFKFTSKAPKEDIFGTAKGSAKIDIKTADLNATKGTITVPVASMETGNKTRDEHLRGADWLDASAHPNITFELTEVKAGDVAEKDGVKSTTADVKGTFTLHGVSTPINAKASIKWKKDGKAKITTKFTIKLADYKVAGSAGTVGSKVGETIQCQATLIGKVQ